ncbi:MAG: SDR family NAD(P)-dependent oxidoreductase [Ruminococcaceae bacterium]|nr:SDR family NAD(P)-dependent oxidoreductase [Oscillospiraceae bacterium]
MKDFQGRVALITGAANGFGKEYVKEAAKRGMRIAAVDIEGEEVKACEALAREGGAQDIICLQADVSLLDDVNRVVDTVLEKYGQIDLLINNAGTGVGGSISTLPLRDWEWLLYTNVFSQIYFMRRVIPVMMKQGTHCNILNVCSLAGLITSSAMPTYYSTKHAAVELSRGTQFELEEAHADIQVSVFCPGFVQTDLHHAQRHRPARFQAPDDPYYQSEDYKKGEAMSEYVVTHGMPIDGFGERCFKAIEDDQFYVVTHKQYSSVIRKQIADRVNRVNPDLTNVGKQRTPVESKGDKSLNGKVALITGAAYGFGKEFVKQAAQRGMKIVAVDIMKDALCEIEPLAKELGAADITLIPADVSLYEETEKVVNATMEKYGQIDLLINNAGVSVPGAGFVVPLQDWEWIFRTNYLAHVYFMRQVVPIMRRQGTHCNILNVCSVAGLITSTGMTPYYTTKSAAVALSECVEYEMQELGADIHLSVFCPGFVHTNFDHFEEYRPARYSDLSDPYYKGEMYAKGQQAAKYVIQTGYPIDGFGEHVFKAIEKDQFYIVTHPEYDKHILQQAEYAVEEQNPVCVSISEAIKDVANVPGKEKITKLER